MRVKVTIIFFYEFMWLANLVQEMRIIWKKKVVMSRILAKLKKDG